MKLQEIRNMREKLGAIAANMMAICTRAEAESRGLTADDRKHYEQLDAKATKLRLQIKQAEEENLRGSVSALEAQGAIESPEDRSYRRAFRNYLRLGESRMSDDDRALLVERRDMGTGGQGAYPGATSGFFVPVGFINEVEQALKYMGPMLDGSVVKILPTETGAPLPHPTSNDTAILGEQVDENAQVGTQDVTLGQLIFGAYKYSSKLVKVSLELAQDSNFNLDSFLAEQFGTRIGRILNSKFTTGTGVNEPKGIVTAATAGVGGASGVAVIGDDNQTTPDPTQQVGYLDLVNLEHSVDPLYRPGAKFMFSDGTLKFLKKLKDKYGRPLWESGIALGKPDTLLGYPYVINPYMADLANTSPATARTTVLFGRLDKYLVRKVKDLTVLRLTERFADYGQIAFLAFWRGDGNLLDAGTHPVKSLVNPAS